MTPFEEAVKTYLDTRASEDAQFAANYAKQNKNFDECIRFIYGEVRKLNTNRGNCIALRDEDVFGLAVHYYDEDDIKVSEEVNDIVADYVREAAAKVELTDEEKAEARKIAVQNEADRVQRKMKEDAENRKKAPRERAKNEAQSECLFLFDE